MTESLHYLQIEPTTRCNFTCGFCCGRAMPQADLDYDRFVAALDASPDLRHVELQGEGEPLMHPRFLDMVALCRARSVRVSFITNGSYFTKDRAARLCELGIEKISVSLESAEAATFQSIRGGKLDKVVRGIETLLEERAARGLDRPVVGFSITVLRGTRDHLPGILALYDRLGLDGGVTLQPLQQMESYVTGYAPGMRDELLSQGEVDDLWIGVRADRALRRIEKARRPIKSFFDELMGGWRAGSRRCPWLDVGLYVNRDGQATACCMVKDVERHGFGQIGLVSMPEILAGRAGLRDELAAGTIPAPCKGCELARFAVMTQAQLLGFGMRGLWRRWRRKRRPAAAPATLGPRRSLPVLPSAQ